MEFVIYNAMVFQYSGMCRILGMLSGKCVDTTELPVRLLMAFGSQVQSKAVQLSQRMHWYSIIQVQVGYYAKRQYVNTTDLLVRCLIAFGSQIQSSTTFPNARPGNLLFRYGWDITSSVTVQCVCTTDFSSHTTWSHLLYKKDNITSTFDFD